MSKLEVELLDHYEHKRKPAFHRMLRGESKFVANVKIRAKATE